MLLYNMIYIFFYDHIPRATCLVMIYYVRVHVAQLPTPSYEVLPSINVKSLDHFLLRLRNRLHDCYAKCIYNDICIYIYIYI